MENLETSFVETENSQNNLEDSQLSLDLGGAKVESKFESINLKSPMSDKNPIYAEINKIKKGKRPKNVDMTQSIENSSSVLDVHTLTVLWLINSGCNVEDCLLEGSEMAGVNFGAFLPTDPKVLRLLLEAGAVEQADLDGCEYESQMSLASTSSEQSPEPLFDVHDLHGQAALHVAARLGQAEVVKVLLEAGANADQADVDGWTPLRAAAWGGHTECFKITCGGAAGAAAWSGHEEIVRILLQNGANVNLTDHEGRTALIAAAYMGHSEIVEHLLNFGADINHADADGRTALSVAALCAPRSPGVNVVSTLLERGATVDHKDKEGMTPDVCELLLENEADVDHCDHGGRSPCGQLQVWAMHRSSRFCCSGAAASIPWTQRDVQSCLWPRHKVRDLDNCCVEVVRQLLDRGLDEQHRDNSGWTPLHYAAFEGPSLEAGARIDETDNEGKAPLALAAQGGHTTLVNLFIEKYNAPVDQRPHDGKTALRLAALEGHYDIIQILVSNGADIDSKDADGRSTLYVLALDNRLAMSKYFIQQGADVETRDLEVRPNAVACPGLAGTHEMVTLLLTYGKAQVDACDLENRTALHSASWQGHSDIVKMLLEHGRCRITPATREPQLWVKKKLICIAAQEGHELCVVALLEHGADPNHSDACGRNALRVAAKSGHRGVVRLLEEFNARSHKMAHTSSSANSITSASTAETKPSCAILYPSTGGASDWSDQQRRSMVSLGNHSSNSKSSSNLTGSSHSSRHGDRQRETTQNTQVMPFQCLSPNNSSSVRGGKTRPLSKLLSPLQSEPQSPIYASPPLSPVHDAPNMFGAMNIYQPVLRHNNFAKAPDPHFARDTHMRIILGNSSSSPFGKDKKNDQSQENSNLKSSNQKAKRNGIVTNPALRLVANVKNGLDTAAANLRKSASGANPASKTNSFHWRKETPL
ncbi:hypothetical protein NQ318_016565 [Aromia moschata]|uniref:Ankyrin repeat domain-containing protein 50 n=1 Tax=Aromia moschata TaxID=1265417 RepID=A0AAV8YWF6_9CUCU|nr:hypothetical protein NQ318_016565 [Aromia moschata]